MRGIPVTWGGMTESSLSLTVDVRQTNTLARSLAQVALPSPLLTTHPLFVLLLLFTASGEMWISVGGVQCSFGIERAARMRDAEEDENGGNEGRKGASPRLVHLIAPNSIACVAKAAELVLTQISRQLSCSCESTFPRSPQ